jgi:hypothetical protein
MLKDTATSSKTRRANGRRHDNSFWTQARVQTLRDQVRAKKSSGQIAAILGCTRRAVVGKAYRLKLAWLHQRKNGADPARKKKRPRRFAPRMRAPKVTPAMFPERPPPMPPLVELRLPQSLNVSFAHLKPHHCRWPYGEGPHVTFCGCPVIAERTSHGELRKTSYCGPHRELSVQRGRA